MKKAFTLIELIMVITVVGIISAVIFPAFINSYNNIKLESAYKQLRQDIKYAQQLAINLEIAHGILFNPEQESYSVYRQITSNIVRDPATQKPLTVYYTSGIFSGVDLVSTTFTVPDTNRLEFDSFGAPQGGGIIILSYDGVEKNITVEEKTGRVI